MAWAVIQTKEMKAWMNGLSTKERAKIIAPIEALEQHGPALGGSLAKLIHGSRHRNMKELRSVGGHQRVLLAFDKQRKAVLLVGGDKTNNWDGWYQKNIKTADRLFDEHIRGDGGGGPWREPRTGERT